MFSQLRMGNTCASEGHSTALTIRNFYFNEVASEPDGDLIEVMLTKWAGKYERLERHHGNIPPFLALN